MAPVLTGVNPSYVLLHDGGLHELSFVGTGLSPNEARFTSASGKMSGVDCNSVAWVSPTEVICNITSARLTNGVGSVASITIAGETASASNAIDRISRPVVTSVSPSSTASTDPPG